MTAVAPAGGPAPGPGALDRLDAFLGRPVSMRALAALRVAVGPVTMLHLWSVLDEVRATDGRPTFRDPYVTWFPAAAPGVQAALLVVGLVAAALMTVGLFTRTATVATLAVVAHHLLSSATNVHNNRAFLVIVLATLAVGPCGRELSLDARRRARRGRPPLPTDAPGWPLWLLRFEAVTLYGASGLSKLLDPDWFGGTVTWLRVSRHRDELLASPLPRGAVDLLVERGFHTGAAKVVIGTELFIAVGLVVRRTRLAAVWVALAFHVAIQLSASVEVFSFLTIATLMAWATPRTRERAVVLDPTSARQRALATGLRALDWLARFRVTSGPPGARPRVVDRDGTVLDGAAGAVLVLSRLPLTAWPALPLRLVVHGPRPARRSRRGPAWTRTVAEQPDASTRLDGGAATADEAAGRSA